MSQKCRNVTLTKILS